MHSHVSSGSSLCCTKSTLASETPTLLLQLALLATLRARTEWGTDTHWPHWRAQSTQHCWPHRWRGGNRAWGMGVRLGPHMLYAAPATKGLPDHQRHVLLSRCLGQIFCAWHHRNTMLCPRSTSDFSDPYVVTVTLLSFTLLL